MVRAATFAKTKSIRECVRGKKVLREIGPEFVELTRVQLRNGQAKIKHCVDQLSDAEFWWRPAEMNNSAGNLILHLAGNLRQWIVAPLNGVPDERRRPAEFSARDLPRGEVLGALTTTLDDADAALARLLDQIDEFGTEILLTARRIQGFDETIMSAIYDATAHFRGHAQEIVYITRFLRKGDYKFFWVPGSPEQGGD